MFYSNHTNLLSSLLFPCSYGFIKNFLPSQLFVKVIPQNNNKIQSPNKKKKPKVNQIKHKTRSVFIDFVKAKFVKQKLKKTKEKKNNNIKFAIIK